jgi:hypothetical protein
MTSLHRRSVLTLLGEWAVVSAGAEVSSRSIMEPGTVRTAIDKPS